VNSKKDERRNDIPLNCSLMTSHYSSTSACMILRIYIFLRIQFDLSEVIFVDCT